MVAITDDQGTLISQHRYLPFGGTRQLANQTTSQLTDFGYTGQRNLDDDIGLMDYKFRFYSPVLGRFISPDTITHGGPQGLNRFSYVDNHPINFNDPTGHKPKAACLEDRYVNGKCLDDVGYLKYDLEQKYKIKIRGNWKENQLNDLAITLGKLAKYLGSLEDLNSAIETSVNKNNKKSNTSDTYLTILLVAGKQYTQGNNARAATCLYHTKGTCSPNTMIFSEGVFDSSYQKSGTVFKRPQSFTHYERVQVTMSHEFVHLLADANPTSVNIYTNRGLGGEEDMANDLAVNIVSEGAIASQFSMDAISLGFWDYP